VRLGIIQGRLLPPENGHIQEFPSDWKRELELLSENDMTHVEWLITRNSFDNNPILKESDFNFSKYVSSICVDNLVDNRITDREFLFSNLLPVLDAAVRHGIRKVTVPILEDSSMEQEETRGVFANLMKEVAIKYPQIEFCFEAELSSDNLLEILNSSSNFYVTYDTGNITSYGEDHEDYLNKLSKFIKNVHLKDRTYDARTVEPGTGDTNFKLIFETLNKIGYNGPYTIQTAREKTGNELNTILKHKNYFEELYNEQ